MHQEAWMYGRFRSTCSSKYRVVFTPVSPDGSGPQAGTSMPRWSAGRAIMPSYQRFTLG